MDNPIRKILIKGKLLVDPIYAVGNFIEDKQHDFEIDAYFYGGLLSGTFEYKNKTYYVAGDEFDKGNFVLFIYGTKEKRFFINYNKNQKNFKMKMYEYKVEDNKISSSIAYMSNATLEEHLTSKESFMEKDLFSQVAFARGVNKKFRDFFDMIIYVVKDENNRKTFLNMVNSFKDKLSIDGIEDEEPRSVLPIAKVINDKFKNQYMKQHGKEKDVIFLDVKEIKDLEKNIFYELDEEDYDLCQKSYVVLTNFLTISAQVSFSEDISLLPYLAQQMTGNPYLKNYIKETPEQLMAYELLEICGEKYKYALNVLLKNMEDIFKKSNWSRNMLTDLQGEFNSNQIDCIVEFYSVLIAICSTKQKDEKYKEFVEEMKRECKNLITEDETDKYSSNAIVN